MPRKAYTLKYTVRQKWILLVNNGIRKYAQTSISNRAFSNQFLIFWKRLWYFYLLKVKKKRCLLGNVKLLYLHVDTTFQVLYSLAWFCMDIKSSWNSMLHTWNVYFVVFIIWSVVKRVLIETGRSVKTLFRYFLLLQILR